MLNFVFADADGRIGWQTSGRLPIRTRGDGTFPFVVTDDKDNWSGWIPYEKMPGSVDPPRGWVGTCNHFTVRSDYPYYYTSHASPSYRYRRLAEVLDKPGKKTVDDHWALQRDETNVMAREIAPGHGEGASPPPGYRGAGEVSWNDGISGTGPIRRRR